MNVNPYTNATPAEIDGQLAKLAHLEAELEARMERLRQERKALSDEYYRRGGWTRAFLVNNADGHVHSSSSCSTLRFDTQLTWLTDYSGKDQAEIIDAAGWRACTVCYPDAPLGYEKRESQIKSDEDVAREQRAAERAEVARQRDEKVVRDADGEVLFKTERSAEIAAVDHLYEVHNLTVMEAGDEGHRAHLDRLRAEHAAEAKKITLALVTKLGWPQHFDARLNELVAKADAKVIRLAKEWNKDPRSNSDWAKKVDVPAKGEAGAIIRKYL